MWLGANLQSGQAVRWLHKEFHLDERNEEWVAEGGQVCAKKSELRKRFGTEIPE